MNTLELLQRQRERILALAAQHGAANVRIFGSVARGEDTTDSDVDFLVSMRPERSLLDLIGFQQDVEALIERPADVVSENGLHPALRDQVLREARPL